MQRVIVLRQAGEVSILSEVKGIRCLLIDRNTMNAGSCVMLGNDKAAVNSLLKGIPKIQPSRVQAIFEEIAMQRSQQVTSPSTPVKEGSNPRILVTHRDKGPLKVAIDSLDIQLLVIDQDIGFGVKGIQVEARPSVVSGLCEIVPDRVNYIFEEMSSQIHALQTSTDLLLKQRVQFMYMAKHWFSENLAVA